TATTTATVTTTFTLNKVNITLATSGAGSGSVGIVPGGTSCGPNCHQYDYGSAVTITANVSAGSNFNSFSGEGCTTANPCSTFATTTATVTAAFQLGLCAPSVANAQLQSFPPNMFGCAGTSTFANRASLCGAGAHVCTANEWVQQRGGNAPSHHYWVADALNASNGVGPCGSTIGCG
ncbi:MAG: hypothetical protein ABR567_06355, partial [Myxococcales bacterium]